MSARPSRPSLVAPAQKVDRRWLRRAPAWLSLAVITLIAVLIAIAPATPVGVQDLSGAWSGVLVEDGSAVELRLPGLFRHQGLPAGAQVRVRRLVSVGSAPHALWIEAPQYAVTVRWDGVELARHGDADGPGNAARARTSASVLVPVPPVAGAHELELDLRGDFGGGGVVGRVLLGPVADVHAAARAAEIQRVALALGMSLLGMLPLVVAARGPWRPAYLFFGLYATFIAAYCFALSDTIWALLPDASANLRLRRLVLFPAGPACVAFLASFAGGAPRRGEWGLLGVGTLLGLLALVVPSSALHATEVVNDVLLGVSVLWFLAILGAMLRSRSSGAAVVLLIAFAPLIYGVGSEMMLTYGLREGTSHLFAALVLFSAGGGAALFLRDAEVSERHERLISRSLDAMVIVDAGGAVRDANPAADRMLGTTTSFLSWIAPRDRQLARAHLRRAVVQPDRAEVGVGPEEAERVLESLGTPLRKGLALLVLRDVTQRRQLARGMLHAARMETVATLLGGMAHDFNNMLGTLLAHVGLLQVELRGAGPQRRLDRMETAIERASQLTRRLLTVARGTGADLGAVALSRVCAEACELVEPTLPAGVQLVVDVPAELPPVHGDPADLEQVVVNLLVNALDAVDGDGTVWLVARAFALPSGGRGVALMVEDDGPGVPLAKRDEVFQPFFTTKQAGTGLGLAVASQILRDHHGRLWYEERPEGGARFLLALRHADAVDSAPAPLPDGRRVLLVEDEEVLLEGYEAALTQAGYTVHAFSDSTKALAWLLENCPDVLVTDVLMPGVSGLELASRCGELYRDVPVLLVSAFIPEESVRALQIGAWRQLVKPVRAARLVGMVGRIRRAAERRIAGVEDITGVRYLLPPLEELTAASVGLRTPVVSDRRAP